MIKRECEIKFKIKNVNEEQEIRKLLEKSGFIKKEKCLLTDYMLDTVERICRKKQFLFRVRNEYTYSKPMSTIYFTSKTKNKDAELQDNCEIEFSLSDKTENIIESLVIEVANNAGIKLNTKIFFLQDITSIIRELYNCGFCNIDIIKKERTDYVGEYAKISIDKFYDSIGTYLEIECQNKIDLYNTVALFNLDTSRLEKRNYGQLILEQIH